MQGLKFLLFLFVLLPGILCKMADEKITYKAIGYFETSYNPATGAPRQALLKPDEKGLIVLKEQYSAALVELDEFEYITVLFHFHLAEGWEAEIRPPESKHRFGLFATRSPQRPNPIGVSVIRLDSISENTLYISGADAFDGTPVLDIKPYLPSVDCPKSKINEEAEKELGHHSDDFITDSVYLHSPD